ncbi:MAG: phosphopantothenoylcysteine decarboxylase [Planctomycetaceae bacterium]|nr:phosphopantothenoylcysteine decarboxylase [Planctomycetaceae bacterium]
MSSPVREILIGVSGGIAAYKSAELVSRLVKRQYAVSVIMSAAAEKFIGRATFEALTNRPVHQDLFSPREHFLGEHIGLVRRADLFVVAPATADLIGKLANGLADDLLSTSLMAAECPVLLAPSMNTIMWNKPATQRNLNQVLEDGVRVISPEEGWLSCRITGTGRMAEPEQIEAAIVEHFAK